ncbi:MAG: Crp/Fnr family transcriptional regulator [Hydrogenophaga sp.]|jgi:CRP-like cAMP-binding protein|uniref:Crp/Fnr family transcriptional regulator n=1 Tax=Comamonadaceae TaxID=80864 RepID=UPI002726B0D1|nr:MULTISPECIES: Crp/Fnr family transcriptional regulator [Comamonadaceae]MDO9252213.1 Crp/Fnr family transcriptional regulator [Hydrogenophaga sp.]MDP2448499.1 Crp/Fnr family transcriptional regulator [Polaromonas sp.]MDP3325982.1 Crp/Fnr family transcriptional regulator [Hydrogenophaga sp.]MDZ4175340.1 Crp/Fnr family transcriptional regulator [Hydrogenophaga sp.]
MDIAQFDLPRYLSMLPLFQEMKPPELQRLAQGSRLRQLARGDDVFNLGDPCNEFHVTVTGQIKLFAISPAGQEKIIEIVGPGNSFAEALMFTDKPYFINAQALTDTLLLSVSKQSVLQEIENDARFCMRMLAGLSRRLHGLVKDVQAYSLHSGVERVIGYLMRDLPEAGKRGAEESAQRVTLPVSKAAIASRLSMTPEYFSRVLHELEAKGLILIDKRDIHIPDPQRLTRYPLD